MMRIKICGITSLEDLRICASAGADALGFVVEYPVEVPWNLTAEQAVALMRKMPPFVISCMVTGGRPGEVVALARHVRPDVVQLHYDETLAETGEIASALVSEGIRVIKALRTGGEKKLLFEIPDPAEAAALLSETKLSGLLVDSGLGRRPGGSGVAADLGAYRAIAAATHLPVILAGGLTADNLTNTVPRDVPPYAVDVLSGVESLAGKKDPGKVRNFIFTVRNIFEML